jgi:hypothetical protein
VKDLIFFYTYNQTYFVIDKLLNIVTNLEVKTRRYNKYEEVALLEQILYVFPTPNDTGKIWYQKLFG